MKVIGKGERIFRVINSLFMIGISLVTLLPFIHIVSTSISGGVAVAAGKVGLLPVDVSLDLYVFLFQKLNFLKYFNITLITTVIGTVIGVSLSALAAYPLSKPEFKGRKIVLYIFIFCMYFDAGMIPGYLLMKNLSLIDNIWAMILPGVVVPFYMLFVKTFYEGLPSSLEEAAKIDGSSMLRTFISIIVPLSKPVYASITVFYAVAFWNNFFGPLIYINSENLKPLTIFLYNLIQMASNPTSDMAIEQAAIVNITVMRAAAIVLTAVPILIVYPFLQRFFVKGIMIGAIKG